MNQSFNIQKGRWDVPGVGRIDSSQEVSEEKLLSLYKLPRRVFPWISLGPDAKVFLKKQNLSVKEISTMVANATSVEELELLESLNKKSKPLKGIVSTKIKSLDSDKIEN